MGTRSKTFLRNCTCTAAVRTAPLAALDTRVRLLEATIDAGDLDGALTLSAELDGLDGGPRLIRQRARLSSLRGDPDTPLALTLEAAEHPSSTPFERALSLAQLHHLRPDPTVRAEAERLLATLGVADAGHIFTRSPLPTEAEQTR